jgi:2-oxoglutarate ferredoxin oxidoreductase subunit beta
MATVQDFSGYTPTWCPGCGNWSIGRAIMNSFSEQGHDPSTVNVMFDIGCSGNMNDFLNASSMHTLHGRSLANAVGCKIANHEMPVVVIGGDGALYGEGGNHFLHACRGNHDITMIIHDNGVYGLTKGQSSPAAHQGFKSKTTPDGIIESPVYALLLAITQGATFVAQAFAGNLPQLSQIITAGMQHRGLSVINVLQPCVTFNKVNTYGYYFQKTYQLKDHNPADFQAALHLAQEPMQEKFPIGVIYQVEKPTYTDHIAELHDAPLIKGSPYAEAPSLLKYFI